MDLKPVTATDVNYSNSISQYSKLKYEALISLAQFQ